MAEAYRTLTVFRHAKSAWPDGVPDFERPLNDRGRADAPAAGRWLLEHRPFHELVLCSPAVRARQTWELAAPGLDTGTVRFDERIYEATAGDLLAIVHELTDAAQDVAVVGHNPGLSDLVSGLTGTPHELKTAAIAVVQWTGSWTDAAPGVARVQATAKPRG